MAFCIAAIKTNINWHQLNYSLVDRFNYLEFFPICYLDYLGVGITILSTSVKNNQTEVNTMLSNLILMLLQEGFEIFEMYSGKLIQKKDINYLLSMIKS